MNTSYTIGGLLPRTVVLCSILLMFAMCDPVWAHLCFSRDPRAGVLDAEAVVIVKQASGDFFEVEETFFGDSKVGDIIQLPDFKLATCQEYGPDLVEPFTPDTRILLFLARKDAGWTITSYGHCYFWVHSLNKVDELRKQAGDTLALRKSWEAARDLPDQLDRVNALWPYLWSQHQYFFEETKIELQKTAPVAGDFVAARFHSLSEDERSALIRDIGLLGGEQLHQIVFSYLKRQQQDYEKFLRQPADQSRLNAKYRREIPDKTVDIDGKLFYGVEGLASFKNPSDLSFIRGIALWAAKHKMEQTCWAILRIFGENQDKANLPVISEMLKQFGGFTEEVSAHSYFYSLNRLKVPETVPLLVEILRDSFMGGSAQEVLTEIVGTDLGTDPQAWLKWYSKRK